MSRRLSSYEQETIINFDKAEDIAYTLTYEKIWQKHLEGRLGLKPVMDNGFGGKEYELPKTRIKPPRAPTRLSDSAKKKLAGRLHRNSDHLSQNLVPVIDDDIEEVERGYVLLHELHERNRMANGGAKTSSGIPCLS